MSRRIKITPEEEPNKAASHFTASITSMCASRLSTSKVSFSDINNYELPELYRWLKHKQRLWKLWQETRDPECKTAVNWVKKTIIKMICRKALEGLGK
jgi:hypothetical protein